MGFASQPIPYPATYDYGSRVGRPTLAIVFHMAEGRNVAQYLAGSNIGRGVSVHYTIEQKTSRWADGEVVRCLPERRISGSINPRTLRKGDDPGGYYGASYAKKALGELWTNPNVAVISVEVAGFAKDGPTPAQQDSMVALWREVDRRYGGVDVLAHRDFQDVKPCPGLSDGIKAAFARMGRGKGGRYMSTRGFTPGLVCDVADGALLYDYPGATTSVGKVDPPLDRAFLGWSPGKRTHALVATDLGKGGRTAWVKADEVANVRAAVPDPASFAQGRIAGLDEAEAAVAAIER